MDDRTPRTDAPDQPAPDREADHTGDPREVERSDQRPEEAPAGTTPPGSGRDGD